MFSVKIVILISNINERRDFRVCRTVSFYSHYANELDLLI